MQFFEKQKRKLTIKKGISPIDSIFEISFLFQKTLFWKKMWILFEFLDKKFSLISWQRIWIKNQIFQIFQIKIFARNFSMKFETRGKKFSKNVWQFFGLKISLMSSKIFWNFLVKRILLIDLSSNRFVVSKWDFEDFEANFLKFYFHAMSKFLEMTFEQKFLKRVQKKNEQKSKKWVLRKRPHFWEVFYFSIKIIES